MSSIIIGSIDKRHLKHDSIGYPKMLSLLITKGQWQKFHHVKNNISISKMGVNGLQFIPDDIWSLEMSSIIIGSIDKRALKHDSVGSAKTLSLLIRKNDG